MQRRRTSHRGLEMRANLFSVQVQGSPMINRLGKIIYWGATGVSGLILLALAKGQFTEEPWASGNPLLSVVFAAFVWLCGRDARYILSR
jgi:hypothetical protein